MTTDEAHQIAVALITLERTDPAAACVMIDELSPGTARRIIAFLLGAVGSAYRVLETELGMDIDDGIQQFALDLAAEETDQ